MRSGGRAGWTPVRSKTSPTGSITIANSGKRASTDWTNTFVKFRKRRKEMSPNTATATADEARVISATRVFDAPPDLVFEMWTDPKHLANWWGPRGFSITTHEFAFKPGGVWRFIMHGPDGTDYPNKIIWRELVRPQRIA